MLLEPSEAAQALNVDEKTVVRWIKKDNLPAESIQGNYQINPVDLLEWATEHGLKVNPALYKMPDADHRPLPSLSQALQAGGIHCGFPGDDKETVLRNAVAVLDLPPEIDPEFILQVLLSWCSCPSRRLHSASSRNRLISGRWTASRYRYFSP
jgi:PTS system nitrogen regulatory IIA component